MKTFRETFGLGEREPIGEGEEKQVFEHPDKPDRVIAVRKEPEPAESVKEMFYLRKILHFLFPQNIPDVDLESPSISVLEKRSRDAGHLANEAWKSDRVFGRKKLHFKQYEKMADAAEKFGWKMGKDPARANLINELRELGIHIDLVAGNFAYSPEGNIQFLDTLMGKRADLPKLREAIEFKRELPGYAEAIKHLTRLEALKRSRESEKKAA